MAKRSTYWEKNRTAATVNLTPTIDELIVRAAAEQLMQWGKLRSVTQAITGDEDHAGKG